MGTPLDNVPYISIESFKKNGDGVKTPVWSAPLDGRLVVFTESKSYKVKRIRNNAKVRVAKCDVRGKLLGPWYEGSARVVEGDDAFAKRAYAALHKKYGWQMKITDLLSRLAGKIDKRALLEISLD